MSESNPRGVASQIRVSGRVVGEVRGDTFYKRIQFSRHALQRPPALAFDLASLADARDAGARYVAITDTESGHVYRVAIGVICSRGFEFDRGFGRQVGLLLDAWARDAEPAAEQLALWAV